MNRRDNWRTQAEIAEKDLAKLGKQLIREERKECSLRFKAAGSTLNSPEFKSYLLAARATLRTQARINQKRAWLNHCRRLARGAACAS